MWRGFGKRARRKVRVFISGSHRMLPGPEQVPALMKSFVKWMAENGGKLHPVEFAALIGKSIPSVERYLRTLKANGDVEFRGAPKNGGLLPN